MMTQKTTSSKKVFNAKEAFAKKMQENIISALEKDIIPWRDPIGSKIGLQNNAVTGKPYQKTNQMFLMMIARINGYNDPRWVTFKQAKEQNWFVKKGAKSVPIIFTSVIDRRDQSVITKESFTNITEDDAMLLRKNSVVKSRIYNVFNGTQVSGIPELPKMEITNTSYTKAATEKLLNTLSEEMDVSINYDRKAQGASYSVTGDYIMSPHIESYRSYSEYAATLFHEFAHASGHQSRLSRKLNGLKFGSEAYAQEELTAELTAAYISAIVGAKQKEVEFENHKAYCQAWYKVISEDASLLYNALIDANIAQHYLIEKGNIQIESPKVTLEVNANTLKNTIQIENYAQEVLGFKVLKVGNFKQIQEHDSCLIYPNNTFFRFSERAGGDIFNFVMHFENVSFKEAYDRVEKYYHESGIELQGGNSEELTVQRKNRVLELPEKASDNQRVLDYLSRERGIRLEVLEDLIERGYLYQDKQGNCVFISYEDGIAKYGMRRSTYSDFRGDVRGSQASNGFIIDNKATTTIFTEGIIDALSIMELIDKPTQYNYVSVNGVAKVHDVFQHYLEILNSDGTSQVDTIITAFDNDEAGQNATDSLLGIIEARYPFFDTEIMTPMSKDFNDDLMNSVRNNSHNENRYFTELTQEEIELYEISKTKLQKMLGESHSKMFDLSSIQKDFESIKNIQENYPLFDVEQIKQILKMIGDGNSYEEYERGMFMKDYRAEYLEVLRYSYELGISIQSRNYEPKIVFGIMKPHEMVENLINGLKARPNKDFDMYVEDPKRFYSMNPEDKRVIPGINLGIMGHEIETRSILDDLIEYSNAYSVKHPYYDTETGILLKPHQKITHEGDLYYEGPLFHVIKRYSSEIGTEHESLNILSLDDLKHPNMKQVNQEVIKQSVMKTEVLEPKKYQSVTISNKNCIKSFTTSDNVVKKVMTFPAGSRYAGYTYVVTMDHVLNVDASKNSITLQFETDESIELNRGTRIEGKYHSEDQQFIKATGLLRAYRSLDFEAESGQFVRLSEKEIHYFKKAVQKNEAGMRNKLYKETDNLLNRKNEIYVERGLIVELQKAAIEASNEGIMRVIDAISQQKEDRIQNFKQSGIGLNDVEMEIA